MIYRNDPPSQADQFLASLTASGAPGLNAKESARAGKGLFGGSRPSAPSASEAYASLLQAMTQQQAPQQDYGLRDRAHDFFATYNGAPTRRDALQAERRQHFARQEAGQFGASFGALAADSNMEGLEDRQGEMRRLIALRQAQGLDTSGFERMADTVRSQGLARSQTSALPEGTPPSVRAASMVNPAGASAHVFDQYGGNIFAGPNGQYLRGAKGGGEMEELQPQQLGPEWVQNDDGSVAPVPGGPQDPYVAYAQNYQGTRGRVDATPPAPVDPMGQGEVLGAVMLKAQREGIEALSPAELQMFTYATTRPEPASFGFPMMPGMGSGQAPAQQQPTQPGRPARPAQAPGSPARPQSQADFDKLSRGAKYIDPDDGQLYEKQ